MTKRVLIQWTDTAKTELAGLPRKVRKGILAKADRLLESDDPRKAHKALVGPLGGFYRFTYARYRAIYSVEEEELANGDVLVQVKIRFVAVGQRKERDKHNIYQVTRRLVDLGIIAAEITDLDSSSDANES